jgi:hypothetical protein
MSAKKRTQTVRELKDKRAKRLAIGGAVVLVALLAFEVPKVMKHGGGTSSTPPAATTTATVPGVSTPSVTPTGTATPAATPTGSTKLPNSDLAPRRGKSQLLSFSHFAGKDPFLQQVSTGSATGSTSGTSGTTPGVITAASVSGSGAGQNPAGQQAQSRTLAVAGAVKISINGRPETVRVGASFPSANPLFKLVSVTRGGIRIGIANGSYTSGAHTVSLQPGRSLTLVDTADGIRYKIRLLSVS